MFTPDFHLPDDDLFVEVTTMRQKLVTKKNRKVKRLMEVHPRVRCKILYQRDYLHLVVKYGLEAPDQLAEVDALPTRIPGPPLVELPDLEETG
jgi:hypoxanthine phosphoribosyltransferase